MTGGAIYHNRANGVDANQGGGGVYASETGSFTYTSGVIGGRLVGDNLVPAGNRARHGGGVFLQGNNTVFHMHNGRIINNTATGAGGNVAGPGGGGVDVYGRARFNMHDGLISGNRIYGSYSYGGGVNVEGRITGPTADQGGSFFNMYGGTISNNHAPNGGGGGVHLTFSAVFNMENGEIKDNIAGHGAGVWIQADSIFTMYNGNISGNTAGIGPGSQTMTGLPGAIANRNGGGGGIMVCCRATFYMHNGTIDGNTGRVGGGIYLAHGARTATGGYAPGTHAYATIHGGVISNNTATLDWNYYPNMEFDGDGGGIFITRTGILNFVGNAPKFVNNNVAENSGGGVRWVTGHWHTQQNTSIVQFIGNEAAQDGGGIYVGGGLFVDDGQGGLEFAPGRLTTHGDWTIAGNEAARGGGVFVGGGTFLDNVTAVGRNTSEIFGGGVLVGSDTGGASFTLLGGTIQGNQAERSGGGIAIIANSGATTFTMHNGVISHNDAESYGGGIATEPVGAGITSTFAVNIRGGIIEHNDSSFAGGGIRAGSRTNLTLGRPIGQQAGPVPAPVVRNNGANSLGGGVSIGGSLLTAERAFFTMTEGSISNNTAQDSGGGVFIGANGQVTATGGTISNNTAHTVGRVYVANGGPYNGCGGGICNTYWNPERSKYKYYEQHRCRNGRRYLFRKLSVYRPIAT